MIERRLTTKQVAATLGVGPRTVSKWARSGQLYGIRPRRRSDGWLFVRSDVVAALKAAQ